MMTYRFLDHTADIAVEVESGTLERLFEEAGLATMEVNADLKAVEPRMCVQIALENKDPERLLFDFLEELIFLKDSKRMILSEFSIKIDGGKLRCKACGEKIGQKTRMGVDVKAVTYHKFSLKNEGKRWKAFFILDI